MAQMTQKTNQFNLTTIRYTENDELALMVEDIPEVDLTFEWEKDKALLFDCRQLHTARKFERPAWKEFIIGFVV